MTTCELQELQVGAIGAIFLFTLYEDDVVIDLSAVTSKQFIFKPPRGATKTVAADFFTDGTDGILQYITVDEDFLDVAGSWKVQADLTFPGTGGYDGTTDIGVFQVNKNL